MDREEERSEGGNESEEMVRKILGSPVERIEIGIYRMTWA